MKRLLAVVVVFALGVGVGNLLPKRARVAEAGQEPVCAPLFVTGDGEVVQDINGDGIFDPIAEAVALLGWAFLGGPAPVRPCEGAPPALPDTGQTGCFAANGTQIPCENAGACPGQDGFYDTGCPSDGRFVDNLDGTVTDNCTGLMWQKSTADENGDGEVTNDGNDHTTWCGALTFCENLTLAGHSDWRLPNMIELQSIVVPRQPGPAIDPIFSVIPSFHWSSTTVAESRANGWGVDFFSGDLMPRIKFGGMGDSDGLVRAVRRAP